MAKPPASSKRRNTSSPRERLDAACAALASDAVRAPPAYARRRAEYLATLAQAVTRDGAKLVGIPLNDGAIEAWEVEALPEAQREAVALETLARAARIAEQKTLSDNDVALIANARADQKKLLSAFQRLRFAGDRVRLAELRRIARGVATDVIDAYDDAKVLVALARHAEHRAWVEALPLGEGAAVARLDAAIPRLGELAANAKTIAGAKELRDRRRRVWTVLLRVEKRLRAAGRYRFHGAPEAADYAAFPEPKPTKKRATKKPAEE